MLLAFLLAAPASASAGNPDVTISEPTPGLAKLHTCLEKKTEEWLIEFNWKPEENLRWRWAMAIVDQCREGLDSVARDGPYGGLAKYPNSSVTPVQLLRSEALYFVDRRIREHFEAS